MIGESDDGSKYINLGLTNSKKRGHHSNIKIHNPQDWAKTSYIRDDISEDPKEYLKIFCQTLIYALMILKKF